MNQRIYIKVKFIHKLKIYKNQPVILKFKRN